MYNIAIIEDDDSAAQSLNEWIDKFSVDYGVEFGVTRFTSIENFLLPRQLHFDIVFFDIELPGMNGMEGAKRFRQTDKDAAIIFVTQLVQYALDGYAVDAVDYMLKPITYNNLAAKLKKAISRLETKQYFTVTLHLKTGTHRLRSSDIYYIEVRGHDLEFFTNDGQVCVTGKLSEYEEMLKPYFFTRCNRYCLVNMNAIRSIDGMNIILRSGAEVQISRRRHKEFMGEFAQYLGK